MLHTEISPHRWALQEHGEAEWYCQLHIHSKLLIRSCLLFNSSSTAKQLFFALVSLLCFVFIRYKTWPWASWPCPNSGLSIRHQLSHSSTIGSCLQDRLSSTNHAWTYGFQVASMELFRVIISFATAFSDQSASPKTINLMPCNIFFILAAFHYFAKKKFQVSPGKERWRSKVDGTNHRADDCDQWEKETEKLVS